MHGWRRLCAKKVHKWVWSALIHRGCGTLTQHNAVCFFLSTFKIIPYVKTILPILTQGCDWDQSRRIPA